MLKERNPGWQGENPMTTTTLIDLGAHLPNAHRLSTQPKGE
jgi:hypothetical protein